MAGDQLAFGIYQDGVGEPECPDRSDDLFDLSLRMRSRIARVRSQALDRLVDDPERAIGSFDCQCVVAHGLEHYRYTDPLVRPNEFWAGDCGENDIRLDCPANPSIAGRAR
jgi:hypothetical protein